MKSISTQQSIHSYRSFFKLFTSSILRLKHLYSHQSDIYIHLSTQLFNYSIHTHNKHRYDTILYPISTDTSINCQETAYTLLQTAYMLQGTISSLFIISLYSTTIDTIVQACMTQRIITNILLGQHNHFYDTMTLPCNIHMTMTLSDPSIPHVCLY